MRSLRHLHAGMSALQRRGSSVCTNMSRAKQRGFSPRSTSRRDVHVRLFPRGGSVHGFVPMTPIRSFCARVFSSWRGHAAPDLKHSGRSWGQRCPLPSRRRSITSRGSARAFSDVRRMPSHFTHRRAMPLRRESCVRSTRATCSLTVTICPRRLQRIGRRQRNTVRSLRR